MATPEQEPKSVAASAETFTQICNSFLRSPEISGEAKLIGAIYASFANKERRAFPGLKRIMKLTGWGRDVVKRGRSELVSKGFIKKIQARDAKGQFGGVQYHVTDKILARRTENPSDGFSGRRENRQPEFQST